MKKRLLFVATAISAFLLGMSIVSDVAYADSQEDAQATTEAVASKLTTARPYPLSDMNDSTERSNLTERLLRMNDPAKLGYVTLLTNAGQIFATFTIQGKVSSTASQLTNTQNIIPKYCGNKGEDICSIAVDSMGDDGSYGPEEGGQNGIFFFTTGGVLIEWNGPFHYTDAPQIMTSAPVVTLSAEAKPSSNMGYLPNSSQK